MKEKSLLIEHAMHRVDESNALLRFLLNKSSEEERQFMLLWLNESKTNKATLSYLRAKLMLS
jgi:hypothetical protein